MGFHNCVTICAQEDRLNGKQYSEALRSYDQALSILPFGIRQVYEQVQDQFGDIILVEPEVIFKFGANSNNAANTAFTVEAFQSTTQYREVYATSNTVDSLVSSSAADTGITINVQGQTIANNLFTYNSQSVILNGQTPVAFNPPLARVTRLINESGTELQGNVYAYDSAAAGGVTAGVPNTPAATKTMISAGRQRTRKGANAFASTNYFILTQFFGSINRGTAAEADFYIEARQLGKVFQPITGTTTIVSGTGSKPNFLHTYDPPIVIPKNSDVRSTVVGSNNNISVTTGFNGYVARIIE